MVYVALGKYRAGGISLSGSKSNLIFSLPEGNQTSTRNIHPWGQEQEKEMLGVSDGDCITLLGTWLILAMTGSVIAVLGLRIVWKVTRHRDLPHLENWTNASGCRRGGKILVCIIGVLITVGPLLVVAGALTQFPWTDLAFTTQPPATQPPAMDTPTRLQRTSNQWEILDWAAILRVNSPNISQPPDTTTVKTPATTTTPAITSEATTTTETTPEATPAITTAKTTSLSNTTIHMDELRRTKTSPWFLGIITIPTLVLVVGLPGYIIWIGGRLVHGRPPLPSPYRSHSGSIRPGPNTQSVIYNEHYVGGVDDLLLPPTWVFGAGLDYGPTPPVTSPTNAEFTAHHTDTLTCTTSTITTNTTDTTVLDYDTPCPSTCPTALPVPTYAVPRSNSGERMSAIPEDEEAMFQFEDIDLQVP